MCTVRQLGLYDKELRSVWLWCWWLLSHSWPLYTSARATTLNSCILPHNILRTLLMVCTWHPDNNKPCVKSNDTITNRTQLHISLNIVPPLQFLSHFSSNHPITHSLSLGFQIVIYGHRVCAFNVIAPLWVATHAACPRWFVSIGI